MLYTFGDFFFLKYHRLLYRQKCFKVDLKICGKFTGEYPCQSVISIKLQCNVIGITLRHGSSPVNLLHIFRIPSELTFTYSKSKIETIEKGVKFVQSQQ